MDYEAPLKPTMTRHTKSQYVLYNLIGMITCFKKNRNKNMTDLKSEHTDSLHYYCFILVILLKNLGSVLWVIVLQHD